MAVTEALGVGLARSTSGDAEGVLRKHQRDKPQDSPDSGGRQTRRYPPDPCGIREMAESARYSAALESSPMPMAFWHDVRYGLRLFAKEPRFSLVAVVTLAVGIAASTILFSLIDAALLRAVPYPYPEQLALVTIDEAPGRSVGPALDEVRTWAEHVPQVQHTCVWRGWSPEVVDTGQFDRVLIRRWSEGCLDLFGVKPMFGRGFTADDTRIGAQPVAMLGHGFWQQRYGGARDVLGRTISLPDGSATIIGVVPATQDRTTSVFVPLRSRTPADEQGRGRGTQTVVRVHAGVSLQEAEAAISRAVHLNPKYGNGSARLTSLYENVTRGYAATIRTLTYAVTLILLLACLNVGALLLARGRTRQAELAVRASLGATRARLVRQLLAESLLLATAAAVLGVTVSWITLDAVVSLVPISLPADAPATMNVTVLTWTTALACGSAFLFGLTPALRLTRRAAEQAIARTSRRGGSPFTRRTGQLIIASEVALATVLLAGAGLMVRSLARLLTTDLGFDSAHVISMAVMPPDSAPDVLTSYFPALWRSVRAVPGVKDAGAIDDLPLIGGRSMGIVKIGDTRKMVESAQILPGYFEAMGIPLIAGRFPTEADLRAPVVVISEDAARKFFGGTDAIGQQLTLGQTPREVSGIVGTVHQWGAALAALSEPKVYAMFGQDRPRPLTIVLRLQPGVPLPTDALRRAATDIGPRVFVEDFQRGSEWLNQNTIGARHQTVLSAILGGLGVILALGGVFSMTAYAVISRTREIGVRMALGARAGQVVGHVLRDAMWAVSLGTAAGVLGALAATRVIAAYLFHTAPTDAPTFLAVVSALLAAGTLAAWVPARLAAFVDPAVTLRSE